jgi:hypothetical protein
MGEKLEIQEFERIVRIGLGRAIIVLQENDPRRFREAVLHACLHDLRYDHQAEGSRGQYVFDLLQLSDDPAHFRSEVLAALLQMPTENCHDLMQLFELARRFAVEGDSGARAAMYQRFAALATDLASFDYGLLDHAAENIVLLDGIEGFLFVAGKLGQDALADADKWWDAPWDGYLQGALEQTVGIQAAQRAIEQARQQSKAVAAYLARVDEQARRQAQRRASRPTQAEIPALGYDALKAIIEEAQGVPPGGLRLGNWAPQDVERAARDLLAEQDPGRLQAYLRIFRRFTFPFDPQPLVALAQHGDAKVRLRALDALSNVQNPLVRELALEMLAAPSGANTDMAFDLLTSAFNLLTRNYQPSDHALIARKLARRRSIHTYHSLGMDALRVFEANPTPECAEVLVSMYDRGPCTECREDCVDLLHRLGRLPDWMARECLYDANGDLRDKARSYRSSSRE